MRAPEPNSSIQPVAQRRRLLFAALLPFLFLVAMVARFGVDVPWSDQWALVPTLDSYFHGRLSFHELWAPYSEHRLLFPRLILLLLARATSWNIGYELAAIVLLASLSFLVFALTMHRTSQRLGAGPIGWELAACSGLFFSLSQKENWFFGWQLQMVLNQLAVVAGFALLCRPQRSRAHLLLAILCGTIAIYSFGNGLLYWLIGAVLLMRSRRELTAWLLCAAPLLALYFHHFANGHSAQILELLHHPSMYALYVLAYLGGPLAQLQSSLGIVAGAGGLVLFAYLVRALAKKTGWRTLSFPIALVSYALYSGALAAISRLSIGFQYAMTSRYMIFSSLLWLANLCLLFWQLRLAKRGRQLYWIGVASILLLALVTEIKSTQAVIAIDYPARMQAQWAYLHDVDKTSEVNVPIGVIRERLQILKRLRLSLFRHAEPGS